MISETIKKAIDQASVVKNSLERNKLNSHLQDALVWAEKLERNYDIAPHPAESCMCPVGATDAKCPVHGTR